VLKILISILLPFLLVSPLSAEVNVAPEKLLGKWCYTHYEVGGQKEEENIPYEFFKNGEFSFKNSASASSVRKAKYSLNGNKLDIGRLASGGLTIVELSESEMVCEWSFGAKRYFKRGECQ